MFRVKLTDIVCFVENLLTSWSFMIRGKLTDIIIFNIRSLQYSIRNLFVDIILVSDSYKLNIIFILMIFAI